MTLRWLPSAADDLQRIAENLRELHPEVEQRIVMELYRGIEQLASAPYKGRPTARAGTRQLIFLNLHYIVTYRVTDRAVSIVRIRHAAQKPLSL